MTRDESSTSYAIIRYNARTYESAGVVAVVRGRENAETGLKEIRDGQGSADHTEGWRYFLERTGLKAGMDPAKATHIRQADLDIRECKYDRK